MVDRTSLTPTTPMPMGRPVLPTLTRKLAIAGVSPENWIGLKDNVGFDPQQRQIITTTHSSNTGRKQPSVTEPNADRIAAQLAAFGQDVSIGRDDSSQSDRPTAAEHLHDRVSDGFSDRLHQANHLARCRDDHPPTWPSWLPTATRQRRGLARVPEQCNSCRFHPSRTDLSRYHFQSARPISIVNRFRTPPRLIQIFNRSPGIVSATASFNDSKSVITTLPNCSMMSSGLIPADAAGDPG